MARTPPWRLDDAGRILLHLARLLLEAGADGESVRCRVEMLADRLGFAAQTFIESERLLLMLGTGEAYRTRIGHVIGTMGIDIGRLVAIEAVAREIADGSLDVLAANDRLEQVELDRSRYPDWLIILAVAFTATSLARLFGADWKVAGAAFLAGSISTVLRRQLSRSGLVPAAVAVLTASISGIVGALPLKAISVDPSLALVTAGMVLVPGVPLINGINDLLRGHSGIGVARLVNGIIIVLAVASGLTAASLTLGMRMPVSMSSGNLPVLQDLLFSGIAAFGFAILFNAPPKAIACIVVCGALSHGLRTALLPMGSDLMTATCLGSAAAGTIAAFWSPRLNVPWTALAFPGVVAMVPGSYAFRGMTGALNIMTAGASTPTSVLAVTFAALVAASVLTIAIAVGLGIAQGGRAVIRKLVNQADSIWWRSFSR